MGRLILDLLENIVAPAIAGGSATLLSQPSAPVTVRPVMIEAAPFGSR